MDAYCSSRYTFIMRRVLSAVPGISPHLRTRPRVRQASISMAADTAVVSRPAAWPEAASRRHMAYASSATDSPAPTDSSMRRNVARRRPRRACAPGPSGPPSRGRPPPPAGWFPPRSPRAPHPGSRRPAPRPAPTPLQCRTDRRGSRPRGGSSTGDGWGHMQRAIMTSSCTWTASPAGRARAGWARSRAVLLREHPPFSTLASCRVATMRAVLSLREHPSFSTLISRRVARSRAVLFFDSTVRWNTVYIIKFANIVPMCLHAHHTSPRTSQKKAAQVHAPRWSSKMLDGCLYVFLTLPP